MTEPLVPRSLFPFLSDVADAERCLERRERIFRRHELVRDESVITCLRDGGRDRTPVELLRPIELVAARHATRMEVADVRRIVANRADDIALHDLHVVDVVEQL